MSDIDPKQMFKIAYLPLPTANVTSATTKTNRLAKYITVYKSRNRAFKMVNIAK